MNFMKTSIEKMRKGMKRQTRRLASDDDQVDVIGIVHDWIGLRTLGVEIVEGLEALPHDTRGIYSDRRDERWLYTVSDIPDELIPKNGLPLRAVYKGGRLYIKEKTDYAIAPGRGKHQVGRFFCDTLRLQRLGDISEFDLLEEGFERDDTFVGDDGTKGEFVAVVKGREIRSQHAGPMFVTVLSKLHGKKFDKKQRVIAIGIGACKWKGE